MIKNIIYDKKTALNISLAQLNFKVGDVAYNTQKILDYTMQAYNNYKANIVVFSELALVGYPAEDFLLRKELYEDVCIALEKILQQSYQMDVYIVLGYPAQDLHKKLCFNACCVIYKGSIIATYYKQELPNYGVFDERRYFHSGSKIIFFTANGYKVALSICEDLWHDKVIRQIQQTQVDLILSLNASPFSINKDNLRKNILKQRAKQANLPIVYVNTVGGQDDLVFDGGSMVVDSNGETVFQCKFFQEDLLNFNIEQLKKSSLKHEQKIYISSTEELVYKALVLGVQDYVNKNNFSAVVIAVSGGIDSALTLAIAVDALGKERVHTVYMPSRYNSNLSFEIVQQQAIILDVKLSVISIDELYQQCSTLLENEFFGYNADTTEENLQARCRGMLLMAISNKKRLLVLSTSNKSEMAVGYSTLYGDMVGGFCVLKDVPKTLVYNLAKYRNLLEQSRGQQDIIPQSVIDRPPSAELAFNQKDSDSLPEYDVLDRILELYVENNKTVNEIIDLGFEKQTINKVINMIHLNEYKRRQAPIGPRITDKSFDRDRRYPITAKNIAIRN